MIFFIFSEIVEWSEYVYILYFFYMEVYNEMGYDLFNFDYEIKVFEDLFKVKYLVFL